MLYFPDGKHETGVQRARTGTNAGARCCSRRPRPPPPPGARRPRCTCRHNSRSVPRARRAPRSDRSASGQWRLTIVVIVTHLDKPPGLTLTQCWLLVVIAVKLRPSEGRHCDCSEKVAVVVTVTHVDKPGLTVSALGSDCSETKAETVVIM